MSAPSPIASPSWWTERAPRSCSCAARCVRAPTSFRRYRSAWPPEWSSSTQESQGHRVSEREVEDLVDAEFDRRRRCAIADVADRFGSEIERASGMAAEASPRCARCYERATWMTSIVADLRDATVVTGENRTMVAPDADVLSELGEAAHRVVRADEALPFAAVAVGAGLVCVGDLIAPADGIAALLRYVPTTWWSTPVRCRTSRSRINACPRTTSNGSTMMRLSS